MRDRLSLLLTAAALLAAACTGPTPAPSVDATAATPPAIGGRVIDGQGRVRYIVTLDEAGLRGQPRARPAATRFPAFHDGPAVHLVEAVERSHGITAAAMLSKTSLGFVADLTEAQHAALARDPRVTDLEESTLLPFSGDATARWHDTTVAGGEVQSWGKVAINPTTASYAGAPAVYVLDSGVAMNGDLNVVRRLHATDPNPPPVPCFGHGTHVAGIIGAEVGGGGTQGIAPGVPLVAITVSPVTTGCPSGADHAAVVAAIELIYAELDEGTTVGIVNMSFNGPRFATPPQASGKPTLRDRLARLAHATATYPGAFITQSAGNFELDACTVSYGPADDADGIMVVGAIDDHGQSVRRLNGANGFHNGALASSEPGSNVGPCVEVWAPGQAIQSSWLTGSAALSGTSMSAPHIAGLAATLLQPGDTPATLEQRLRSAAYLDVLGSSDAAGAGIVMPTAAKLPANVPHNTPYAEVVMTAVGGLPSTTAAPPTHYVLQPGQPRSLHFDSAGAGAYTCDVVRRRLPLGLPSTLATLQRGVISPVTWPAGSWLLTSVACPSATATVASCEPLTAGWTVDGVSQAPGASLTRTVSQPLALGYASNGASCAIVIQYLAPSGFVEVYPGYPLVGLPPSSASVAVPREVLTYQYELTCTDVCGATENVPLEVSIVADPVVPVDDATVLAVSVPSTVAAGATFTGAVTVQNTGTTTWTHAAGYRLGSQNPPDGLTWGTHRFYLGAGESIAPAQSKTFTATFTAPATPGTYGFQWRMVREPAAWFGATSANVDVAVTGPACGAGAVCTQGATRTTPCGNCGTRVETCDASCQWVAGPCGGQGVCAPGNTQGCCGDECGGDCECEGYRTCTAACTWASACEEYSCDFECQ